MRVQERLCTKTLELNKRDVLMLTFIRVIMALPIGYVLQTGQMFLTGFDVILKKSVAIIAIVRLAHDVDWFI